MLAAVYNGLMQKLRQPLLLIEINLYLSCAEWRHWGTAGKHLMIAGCRKWLTIYQNVLFVPINLDKRSKRDSFLYTIW